MTPTAPPPRPLVVAHRGNSSVAPENTLAAFSSALSLGVDAVEMDLRLTRDAQVVLMHDQSVDRTTDGSGDVAALELAELARLDAGSWKHPRFVGEPPPSFEAALRLLAGKCRIFAEFKVPALAAQVARLAEDAGVLRQLTLLIWPKHPWNLEDARRLLPQCPVYELGAVPDELPADFFEQRRAAGVSALNYEFKTLTPEFVRAAGEARLPVLAWTVNERTDVQRALALGLDGITSDDPALVLQMLANA